jgi:hypothetical protein
MKTYLPFGYIPSFDISNKVLSMNHLISSCSGARQDEELTGDILLKSEVEHDDDDMSYVSDLSDNFEVREFAHESIPDLSEIADMANEFSYGDLATMANAKADLHLFLLSQSPQVIDEEMKSTEIPPVGSIMDSIQALGGCPDHNKNIPHAKSSMDPGIWTKPGHESADKADLHSRTFPSPRLTNPRTARSLSIILPRQKPVNVLRRLLSFRGKSQNKSCSYNSKSAIAA